MIDDWRASVFGLLLPASQYRMQQEISNLCFAQMSNVLRKHAICQYVYRSDGISSHDIHQTGAGRIF